VIGRLCVALVCCGPLACQAPATSESACPGGGDPGVTARSKPDGLPLADGASLPVLNTAQGGLITELDIAISGVAQPDFDTLVVDIYDENRVTVASQQYNGAGLPLTCRDDGVLEVSSLPVGFDVDPDLALDGAPATLAIVVETSGDTLEAQWSIVLQGAQ